MLSATRLFHFSEQPDIREFVSRTVRTPAVRRPGQEWLSGSLVWAIDDWHQPLYFFPRECPRVLLWPTAATTPADRQQWFGDGGAGMIAFIEEKWRDVHASATVYRYELPTDNFESLKDAGMWVSRQAAVPLGAERLDELPALLVARDVELRILESLVPLRALWRTSLHVSGIRLRSAEGWSEPGPPRSSP